jgi:hypothetical protein
MEMNSVVPPSHLVVTLQRMLSNYHPLLLCLDQILMETVPSLPSFALDNLQLILTLVFSFCLGLSPSLCTSSNFSVASRHFNKQKNQKAPKQE